MSKVLIVGGGLGGAILALECYNRGLSFQWMVSKTIPSASNAAYGICNPVQFRNKVPAWGVDQFYPVSKSFFLEQASKQGVKFYKDMPIYHLVVEQEELTFWRQQAESTSIWKYTSGEPNMDILAHLVGNYQGAMLIREAFYVSIPDFIDKTKQTLADHIEWDEFDYKELKPANEKSQYKNSTFTRIIFAEGVHGYTNPWFNQVPFNPCKGEMLVIRIPGLSTDYALHKKIILVPRENDVFECGATYSWDELDFHPSVPGKEELEDGIRDILGDRYPYEIIEHKAGVRPAISDRRPVVGWHPLHQDIGILNGFGSMGLMVGPSAAKNLLNNLESGEAILPDWDVNRFKKRLLKNKPDHQ